MVLNCDRELLHASSRAIFRPGVSSSLSVPVATRLFYSRVKFAVSVFLISLACNCALFGWLESTVNMIEGLGLLFAPGAGTVVFSPFLLLFIVLTLSVFTAVPLLATAIVAALSGYLLRSRRIGVTRSFSRAFVLIAVLGQFAIFSLDIAQNAPFLRDRPRVRPKSPAYVLALTMAANAALNLFVAMAIARSITAPVRAPKCSTVATVTKS
jgi:hypothetical protein